MVTALVVVDIASLAIHDVRCMCGCAVGRVNGCGCITWPWLRLHRLAAATVSDVITLRNLAAVAAAVRVAASAGSGTAHCISVTLVIDTLHVEGYVCMWSRWRNENILKDVLRLKGSSSDCRHDCCTCY